MSLAPDYPDGVPEDVWADGLKHLEENWGRGLEAGLPLWALTPDRVDDPIFRKAHGRWERLSASPGAAVAIQEIIYGIDVRHLLSAIRVPTLVVYRTADWAHAAGLRYLGARIPGAKVVELQGSDYFP
jgi:pimeloyl-ACP methyl ester carboxylesterase